MVQIFEGNQTIGGHPCWIITKQINMIMSNGTAGGFIQETPDDRVKDAYRKLKLMNMDFDKDTLTLTCDGIEYYTLRETEDY
tara:strand:+ start:386 stop:631 length:246 start_codon:yes stop_codon:yes gene_type:complete